MRLSAEHSARTAWRTDTRQLSIAPRVLRLHGPTFLPTAGDTSSLCGHEHFRAKETAHAWVVADDVGQAADDLRRDWSARRTPTWALDTRLPTDAEAIRQLGTALPLSDKTRVVAIALAQAKASSDAVKGLEPPGRTRELLEARAALARAEQDLSDLQTAAGAYSGTEAGRAVSDLVCARAALTRGKWTAEHSPRWLERRAAAKQSAAASAQIADAEGRWEAHAAPEVARLEAAIHTARQNVEGLVGSQEREAARWSRLAEHGHAAGSAADRLAAGLAVYREALEGEKSHTPWQDPRPVRRAPSVAPVHHQPTLGRDFGPDL